MHQDVSAPKAFDTEAWKSITEF